MRLILMISTISICLFASPQWLYHLPHKSYEIVGYGIDENLQIARNIAKSEIAEIMMVKISTSTKIDSSDINGDINISSKYNLSTSTQSIIQGAIVIREDFFNKHWYVAVKYDNRTLLQKIQIKYPNFDKSYLADITSIPLIRKNNNWYIKVENDLYFFSNQDFSNIFSSQINNNLSFKSNKKIYLSQEQMKFKIHSNNKGFISILYSEENGKIGIVASNISINSDLNYPSKKSENELIAYNPTSSTLSELYICIYSKNRLDLEKFENISSMTLDDSNYNFDKLIEIMRKHIFSTIKIKIRAGNGEK